MFTVVGVVGYTTCGYSTVLPEFMMYDVFTMNVAGCGCEWLAILPVATTLASQSS